MKRRVYPYNIVTTVYFPIYLLRHNTGKEWFATEVDHVDVHLSSNLLHIMTFYPPYWTNTPEDFLFQDAN